MPGLAATLAGRLPVRLASPLTRDKGVPANALRLNGVPLRLNGSIILMVTT